MRPGRGLLAALYPFGAGAMGVNLFFASLIGSWLGWPVLAPWQAAIGGWSSAFRRPTPLPATSRH